MFWKGGNPATEKDEEETGTVIYRQLMEKLSMEPDPMIREYTAEGLRSALEGAAGKKWGLHHVRYDSTAGVLSGGKVLLGLSVPSHWRGTGLPPTEMKFLLVDLKTGEPVCSEGDTDWSGDRRIQ